VIQYGAKGVFAARRGDTFGLQFDQSWTRLLQRGGWWAPSYKTFDDFWKQLQEKGGWWDPLYDFKEWDRVFSTRSRKFEFYAQGLRAVQKTQADREPEDSAFLPHGESPKFSGDSKEYPFYLHTFKTMPLTGGRNANQPWLQAIAGPHLFVRWETWVELNPGIARKLGIADGDWVWVESPAGKIKVIARLYKGAMPDVVSIPFGDGHRTGGRWTKNLGENPYRLLMDDLDPATGYPIKGTTRVKVYKA
jgi:anaerobic selenocysteine-containing dehydrogenase